MFYELNKIENDNLERDYQKMMANLNEFYGINWVENLPKIFLVENRKQINELWGKETSPWVVGWTTNNDVFVLKKEKMETESDHVDVTDEKYFALIQHELSHCFTKILSNFSRWTPKWLWEGVAIYTSGQLEFKDKPKEFTNFLDFYEQNFAEGVYRESGFAVEVLVDKFGKQKLLNLIKNLKEYQNKELFERAFEKEYGFSPNYQKFNEMLN